MKAGEFNDSIDEPGGRGVLWSWQGLWCQIWRGDEASMAVRY